MKKLKILLLILLTSSPILSQVWTNYNLNNLNIEFIDLYDLDIDSKQNIWIASLSGLIKYDGTDWTLYDTTNSDLPSNELSAVEVDLEDNIWMGMRVNYGVSVFDGSNWINYNKSNSIFDPYTVFDIKFDKNNNPWFGTWEYLWTKKDNNWTQIKHTKYDDNISKYVFEVEVDKNNDIWFTTSYFGLIKYSNGKLSKYSNINPYYYDGLAIDSNNNVWFVNNQNSLMHFNTETQQWKVRDTTETPMSQGFYTHSIIVDKNNTLWIAENNKLHNFNPKTEEWLSYSPPDSLLDSINGSRFTDFKLDKNGNFWFITYGYEGVFKLSGAITDVANYSDLPKINIYPNPAGSLLNISTTIANPISEINISNLESKVILTQKSDLFNKMSINIQNLSSGVYFLKLTTANGVVYSKKFLKE